MREEMLKRLDEIIDDARATQLRDAWDVLRVELAAERCENCAFHNAGICSWHWRVRANPADSTRVNVAVEPDFCCAHFEARK